MYELIEKLRNVCTFNEYSDPCKHMKKCKEILTKWQSPSAYEERCRRDRWKQREAMIDEKLRAAELRRAESYNSTKRSKHAKIAIPDALMHRESI